MKKRIALAAAIALAISVGGVFPASAAKLGAPVIGTSSCARAGGTIEVKQADGNIVVGVGAGVLTLDVATADSDPANCASVDLSLVGLTSVVLKAADKAGGAARGNITITLEGATAGTLANFGSIPMTLQAVGTLKFDGSGLTDSGSELRPITGTVTEEAFSLGSVVGSYYAGELNFAGGNAGDTFDASAVTTTPVVATGGSGNDVLKGGARGDDLTGAGGQDKMFGNGGDDDLNGSDGGTIEVERGKKGKLKIISIPSNSDEAWGGAGSDLIDVDGSDIAAPGDGADSITLGNGTVLLYADSSAAITVNLTSAAGVVRSTAGDDFYSGGTPGAFAGSEFADTLVGSSGADEFYGESGADIISGLGGGDVLGGGGGTDKIKGGAGDDAIYGDTGADLINGGADNDTIEMGGGDDVAYGSTGDDVLRGQKGSDQAWGGKGTFDVCAAEVTDSCEFKK